MIYCVTSSLLLYYLLFDCVKIRLLEEKKEPRIVFHPDEWTVVAEWIFNYPGIESNRPCPISKNQIYSYGRVIDDGEFWVIHECQHKQSKEIMTWICSTLLPCKLKLPVQRW